MTMKIVKQMYNIFKGLHTIGSPASRPEEFAFEARNVTLGFDQALHKRPGAQLKYYGQPNDNVGGLGAFTYYTQDASGNNIENVVVNDDKLWLSGATDYSQLVTATASVPALAATIDTPLSGIFQRSADLENFEHPSYYSILNNLYINTGYNAQFKWDGVGLYKSGLPTGTELTHTGTAGGAAITLSSTNSVVWRSQYFMTDYNRQLIEGDVSTIIPISTLAAGGYASVSMTLGVPDFRKGYQMNYARVNTGSGAGALTDTFLCDGEFIDGTAATVAGGADDYYPSVVAGQIVCVTPRNLAGVLLDSTYVTFYKVSAVTAAGADTRSVKLVNLDGSAVSIRLDADDYISTMGARVYRNADGGTTWFLVREIPVSPVTNVLTGEVTSSNVVFVDTLADTSLQSQDTLIEYDESREPAPRCKYSCVWRDTVVLAGDPTAPNTVYYSSYQGQEYFSTSLSPNFFTVGDGSEGRITGIGTLGNSLFIFKERNIFRVTGNFADDDFRVDTIPNSDMGCIAFHTIKNMRSSLAFLSFKGVFLLSESGDLTELSSNIRETFAAYYANTSSNVYRFKRAVAINWSQRDKYMVYIPIVASGSAVLTSTNVYDDGNDTLSGSRLFPSTVFVFDYFTGFISKWTHYMSWLGGVTLKNGTPWWVTTVYNSMLLINSSYTFKNDRLNPTTAFIDDLFNNTQEPITFLYITAHHSGGASSLLKKFLRVKILSSKTQMSAPPFTINVEAYLDLRSALTVQNRTTNTPLLIGLTGTFTTQGIPIEYQERTCRLRLGKARYLQLAFKNSENVDCKIDGYEVEVAVPFETGIKE